MLKKLLFSALGIILPLSVLLAQGVPTGGVKGTVISRTDRTPISGAEIKILQRATEVASTTTLSDGTFTIEGLSDGMYDLVVLSAGYLETRVNATVNDGYVKQLFNITMTQVVSEVTEELMEEFDMDDSGYNDNPTVLFGQNDVFNSIAGYNFSSVRFRARGYTSESQDVYLAGVKMNDAITGYSPFSLWSGLNEATRSKTTVNGAEVSDFGLGGYNGLTNITGTASAVRNGLRGSVLTNSSLYRLRLMLTYASGRNDKGWAYAVSASARLGGNDWIDGVYYRSFGLYGSVEKSWGDDKHNIALTFLTTPGNRGAQNASTQEVYDLIGDNMYNSNWGYQGGKVRNSRVRITNEPIAFIKYDYTPSFNFKASATVLYRFGKNGYTALDWYDAQDPRPDYYRNLPSYFWMENTDYNRRNMFKYAAAKEAWTHPNLYEDLVHLNWDRLYDVNRNSLDEDGLKRAKYILEERHVDQKDLNFALNFKWRAADSFILTGGARAKMNKTEYYKIVNDLLGADYYLNIDSFAEREYASSEAKIQNDLEYYLRHGQTPVLHQGDKFGYDYYAQVRNMALWLNGHFAIGSFSADLGGELGYENFWRDGLVKKGLFPGLKSDGSDFIIDGVNISRDSDGNLLPTSFGRSEVCKFLTYKAKLNLNYVIGGKMRVYANVGTFADAPNFNMAFLSPRTRNSIVNGLTTIKTNSVDVNWQYTGNGFNARLTGYYTTIKDQTDIMSAYDDLQNAFSNFALSGIDEQHMGVEFGFRVPTFIPSLSLQGVVSYGRYIYTSNPTMVQTLDNTATPVEFNGATSVVIPYWKDSPVYERDENGNITDRVKYTQVHYIPSTPQLATSIGLNYNYNYWFIDADFEYFDKAYLDMNPLYRTDYATQGPDLVATPTEIEYMTTQEKFDPAMLVNFSVGKSWYIQRQYQLGFSLNVKNLLNNKNVKTGGYEQTRMVDSTVGKERYYRFDPKYFYMSGLNYMLNVYFRF